jgi:hypothetical protein
MIYSPFYLFPRQHVNEQALACCWGWPIDLSRERLDSLPPLFMLVHFSEGRERERERGMPRYGESDESSVERSLNVPSRESVLGSLWSPPPPNPFSRLLSCCIDRGLKFRNYGRDESLVSAGQWETDANFMKIARPKFPICWTVVSLRPTVVWRWCAHQGISLQFGTVARASLSHGQTTSRWRSRSYLFDVGYRALISHSGSFHRVSI